MNEHDWRKAKGLDESEHSHSSSPGFRMACGLLLTALVATYGLILWVAFA